MEKSEPASVFSCGIIHFPKIKNRAGNLTALENYNHVPFEIKRVYYLYDIPGGESRGGHAHRHLHQYIIALSGSFDILIDDGKNKKVLNLNRPDVGLHLVPGIWRELMNFSSGSVCLVLASELYDESDYIRNYADFLSFSKLERI